MKIDKSKLDKKMQLIESALQKIRDGREGWITRLDLDLTREEFDVIETALEIAAGICTEATALEITTANKERA
jgi:BMFP domain-containing protein YqiC